MNELPPPQLATRAPAAPLAMPTPPGVTTAAPAPVASTPVPAMNSVVLVDVVDAPEWCSTGPSTVDAATDNDALPPMPRPLTNTRWLRSAWVLTFLASGPSSLLGIPIGLMVAAASVFFLLSWTGLAVRNVGRARLATTHHAPPSGLSAMSSWFAGPLVAGAGLMLLVPVSEWAESGTFEQQESRTMIFLAAVLVVGVTMLMALYRPHAVLGRASRWVSGDSAKFRKWFIAPFAAALVALTVQVLSSLFVVADSADGETGVGSLGSIVLFVASFGLPSIAWLVYGVRSMIDLEEATRHQHGRAIRDATPLDQLVMTPILATRLAASATH